MACVVRTCYTAAVLQPGGEGVDRGFGVAADSGEDIGGLLELRWVDDDRRGHPSSHMPTLLVCAPL